MIYEMCTLVLAKNRRLYLNIFKRVVETGAVKQNP